MAKITLFVPKMDCNEEVKLIKNRLSSIPEIQEISFNLIERELIVTYKDINITSIQNYIKTLGMETEVRDHSKQISFDISPAVTSRDWLIIVISGCLALLAEGVAFISTLEDSAAVIILSIASMLIGGRQTFLKGLRALRYFSLNMNFLMCIAISGAIAIGEWPEAAMVTFLFALAELIEVYSLDKARHAIRSLMEITPDTATVQVEDRWQTKPISEVKIGDVVRVKPGERIPLDGVIFKGQSSVNQAPITGESLPILKKSGDTVFAGTINERGSFEFKINTLPENTLLAKIQRTIQQAQAERANTQRFVDKFASYYTPIMILMSVLVATVPPLYLNVAFLPWVYKALVLLVIACPCALVISTPVTIVSGLAAAAKHGVLIKGGIYLELGHKLQAIAFDKTGTLTIGKPIVTDIWVSSAEDKEYILQLAASLDSHSEHPIATAIVHFWMEKYPNNKLFHIEQFEAIPGRGVTGLINDQRYFLGNHRLAEDKGICSSEVENVLASFEKDAKTTIVLGTQSRVLGILAVADTPRDSSFEAIKEIHQLGLKTIMITGDNPTTAQAIAKKIGLDDIKANLLPEDKLNIMDELLQKYHVVGMTGDGINDAPALAKASIGIAMGHGGTDIALETADIVLMDDNLTKISSFIKLSRRTWFSLIVNISLSISVKLVFFVLALFGLTTLWMAVFADMGASLIVVINGLRLLNYKI